MSAENTYEARLKRIHDAVEFKEVDKIPVSINGPAFVARSQGLTIKEFIFDFDKATQASINLMAQMETADCIQSSIMWPDTLSGLWMSKVLLPGVDLGDDELWQVVEAEVIKPEDYDFILENGFPAFVGEVMGNRLHVDMEAMGAYGMAAAKSVMECAEAGFPVLNDCGNTGTPFESLCGGRTLQEFFMDLIDDPDRMVEVLDETMKFSIGNFTGMLEANLAANPNCFGAWVGGWRAAPSLLATDQWEKFVWPYFKQLAMITLEYGITPVFHLDSNWDRGFEYFKELPAHKCIMSLDGTSDIRLARKILGDHMALMGDIPASLLAFGTADEVRAYTTSLIRDVGPETGLIVCSGCDIPINAKVENVKAMVDAARDFK